LSGSHEGMKEKVIGILGGMGPEATVLLFQRILENTVATRDQEHARIIIDNNPKIPDRLPAILGKGENPVPQMVESGRVLEKAGADFILIPCVSAHYFLPDLRRQLKLPILSMLEETASLVGACRPRISRIGLLAALGTVRSGIFQGAFAEKGIETLISEEGDLQRVQENILRVKDTQGGHDRKILGEELKEIGEKLFYKGAQGIIAGCTELPIVLSGKDFRHPFFDVLTILARSAVKRAGLKPTRIP
jgi:aspartate racemase